MIEIKTLDCPISHVLAAGALAALTGWVPSKMRCDQIPRGT